MDDLRPKKSVEVTCRCGMSFWIEALHPGLPDGPFVCPDCSGAKFSKESDFQIVEDDGRVVHLQTKCPRSSCKRLYKVDANHQDFTRIKAALERGDRSVLFCYHVDQIVR